MTTLDAQIAPDFLVTDTHGNEHSLYEDYLDQGKTVVLDLFFVNCPPCNDLAPYMEEAYQQWGAGMADVEFISLTSDPADTDAIVLGFEEQHGTTWPAVSAEGGGPDAQAPYTTGDFGQFFGYPTLVVISPDRSVQFDAWGSDFPETIEILNSWITNTGATGEVTSSVPDLNVSDFNMFPNPAQEQVQIEFDLEIGSSARINVFNSLGQAVISKNLGNLNAGNHQINLVTETLANGQYIVELSTDNGAKTNALSIVR